MKRFQGGWLRPPSFLIFLLWATTARGHDFWLEPSTFSPRAGTTVEVALRVGERRAGEPVRRDPGRIERFTALQGDRQMPVAGAPGDDPAGTFVARTDDPVVIIYQSRPRPVTLSAAQFETYLREEGLERIVDLRARRGASRRAGRELFSRCAKALLAGTGEPQDRVSGMPLEIIAGADLQSFEVRYEQRPVAGLLVTAMPDGAGLPLTGRTDSRGRIRLPLTAKGTWLIKTVHMVPAPSDSGAEWESLWASLTFRR